MTFTWSQGKCNVGCCQLWYNKWCPPWEWCWLILQILEMEWQWLQLHYVHEYGTLPFVFVISCWCYKIAMQCLCKLKRLGGCLGVVVWKYEIEGWECANCKKPTTMKKHFPLLQLEPYVFQCQHLFPWEMGPSCARYYRSVQLTMYFILLPLTQHLMSLRKNQNLYSILLVKWYSFFTPLYVGAWMPFFLVSTLTLHKVLMLACFAQHILVELGEIW